MPRSSSPSPPPAERRHAWVEVDLRALRTNLAWVRSRTGGEILGLVKGDAYGHGALPVARCLEAEGVDWLGVAYVEEGVALRRAGLQRPILVLAPIEPEQRAAVLRNRLTPTVSSLEQLELWRQLHGPTAISLHLKLDSGMYRLGLPLDQLDELLRRLRASPHLRLGGMFSHFSASEDLAHGSSAAQEERFDDALARLTVAEREHCRIHLANSAAALHRPSSRRDLVRVGGALYGVDLAAFVDRSRSNDLAPVMSVHARILVTKEVPEGGRVGYGGRWQAARSSRVAVLPLGYADGYSTRLGDAASVLVEGRRVPIAGAVSMDLLTIDVTGTDAAAGSDVVLLGRWGKERISVEELARGAGISPYEVMCRFGMRLPRLYVP